MARQALEECAQGPRRERGRGGPIGRPGLRRLEADHADLTPGGALEAHQGTLLVTFAGDQLAECVAREASSEVREVMDGPAARERGLGRVGEEGEREGRLPYQAPGPGLLL